MYFGSFEEDTLPRLQSSLLTLKLDPFTYESEVSAMQVYLGSTYQANMNPPIADRRAIKTTEHCRTKTQQRLTRLQRFKD